jgi:hypothetical protein
MDGGVMPYINPSERVEIDELIEGFVPADGGELQYAIARMVNSYYERVDYESESGVRYKHMESIMGSLNGAALEHYRCVVAPYEELKINQNGGVYDVKCGGYY